jgi:hypothetical protein
MSSSITAYRSISSASPLDDGSVKIYTPERIDEDGNPSILDVVSAAGFAACVEGMDEDMLVWFGNFAMRLGLLREGRESRLRMLDCCDFGLVFQVGAMEMIHIAKDGIHEGTVLALI